MRGAAATSARICRSGSAAQHLPAVEAIDLRREGPPRGRFIAPRLAEAVQVALERSEQALLFLNRRGYAPLTLCRHLRLPLALSELRRLAGRSPLQAPAGLPSLRLRDAAAGANARNATPPTASLRVGPGVERLAAGGRRAVSRQRACSCCRAIWSSRSSGCAQELDDVAQGRFDIVIGTQLVAKGHHFPKLNLVGIVDADLGLGNGDPRAAERTFQLLHQVVGRAGREDGRGAAFCRRISPSIR